MWSQRLPQTVKNVHSTNFESITLQCVIDKAPLNNSLLVHSSKDIPRIKFRNLYIFEKGLQVTSISPLEPTKGITGAH